MSRTISNFFLSALLFACGLPSAAAQGLAHAGVELKNNLEEKHGYRGVCYGAFSPDGKIVACSCEMGINLWDTKTHEVIGMLRGQDRPDHMVFSGDGKLLASSGGYDHTVCIWDIKTKKLLYEIQSEPGKEAGSVLEFFPDNQTLVTWGKSVNFWDASTGKYKSRLPREPAKDSLFGSGLSSPNTSANGRYFLTEISGISSDPNAKPPHPERGKDGLECWDLTAQRCIPLNLANSPDMTLFASNFEDWYVLGDKFLLEANRSGTIGLWNLFDGKWSGKIPLGEKIECSVLSGKCFAYVIKGPGFNGPSLGVAVIDVDPPKPIARFPNDKGVWRLILSPDGRYLLGIRSQKDPILWDLPEK